MSHSVALLLFLVPILSFWQARAAPGITASPSAPDICLSIDHTGLALDQTEHNRIHLFLQYCQCQLLHEIYYKSLLYLVEKLHLCSSSLLYKPQHPPFPWSLSYTKINLVFMYLRINQVQCGQSRWWKGVTRRHKEDDVCFLGLPMWKSWLLLCLFGGICQDAWNLRLANRLFHFLSSSFGSM